MKQAIFSFIKYYLFWICYFLFFKVFFLLVNFQATSALPMADIWGIFGHGLKMDLSSAGYLSLFAGLVFSLSPFIRKSILNKVNRVYTLVMLIIVTIAGLADIALYPVWGTRLDAQVLIYLKTPLGAFASVSWLQICIFILAECLIVVAFYYLYKRFFQLKASYAVGKPKWFAAPIILFLTAVLIIPIRGGFDTSPLNFSSVYFSKNLYANHSAYNFFWAFNYAITHRQFDENPTKYMSEEECHALLQGVDLLSQEASPIYIKSKNDKAVNVIVVILESFSNKVIEPLGGLPHITPRLNEFCNEGILFSSFYATGTRSDKGISSLLAGYPALIKASAIVNFPEKMKHLDYLGLYFKDEGYDMSFYYGGDVNFYNTRMLLIQSGIENIISRPDFPMNVSSMQKWGVPDQYLFDQVAADILPKQEPFFSIIYNISSHEPFDIPDFNRIKGNSNADRYCNSVAYTDSCLGVFVDKLKESPLWDNTLLVITSDHASLEPGPTTVVEPASYKIPLLLIGGAVDTTFVSDHIGMQTDLSATLVHQMGWKHKPSYFSKNLFGSNEYAFYFRNDGWGFAAPEAAFYMNMESGEQNFFYGEHAASKDSITQYAKAFTQFLHQDFMAK